MRIGRQVSAASGRAPVQAGCGGSILQAGNLAATNRAVSWRRVASKIEHFDEQQPEQSMTRLEEVAPTCLLDRLPAR